MHAIPLARPVCDWEGVLDGGTGDEVRDRFLRLAGGGLDRAYRLAGL